jgi:CBS domain-containing protein
LRAGDIAARFPTVGLDARAEDAARLLAGQHLPGVIVVDEDGAPRTVLAGTDVLRWAVPAWCEDDPPLARVIDEDAADLLLSQLAGRTVRDCLPGHRRELPTVEPDATALEVAALMLRADSPLVAVVDGDGRACGVVTLDALLHRVLAS